MTTLSKYDTFMTTDCEHQTLTILYKSICTHTKVKKIFNSYRYEMQYCFVNTTTIF